MKSKFNRAIVFGGIFSAFMFGWEQSALSQSANLDNDVDVELDQIAEPYSSRGPVVTRPARTQQQPVYIYQQSPPTGVLVGSQVQKQPTTVVEASPLTKSRADQMREARQQTEAETETRIVEKLEQSRIDDEKRRSQVLFGEGFNNLQNQNQLTNSQLQTAPPPAPVVAAPPPPLQVQVVQPEPNRDLIREEVRAAMDEEHKLPEAPLEQRYFSALAGVGEYPDVSNVKGNYLMGAAFGTRYEDTYAVEGAFMYSNYSLEKVDGPIYIDPYYGYVPRFVDVHQYSVSLAVKYMFLTGMVKPILGGVAQYSYRTFEWSNPSTNPYGYNYNNNNNNTDATSHAVDLGIITGVDLEFSSKLTLGVDFRYLFNLSNRTNNGRSFYYSNSYGGTPIEKLQYYNLAVAARISF